MRTIETIIYKFEELEQETQEKIIEKVKRDLKEDETNLFLQEAMEEKAKELLKETFGKNAIFKACFYSLSYCQGDGAMIEFDLLINEETVKVRNAGHYCHERSFNIDYYTEETGAQYEELKEKIIEMNEKLSKYGYQFIETEITEEDAREYIESNDLEFYASGKPYYTLS